MKILDEQTIFGVNLAVPITEMCTAVDYDDCVHSGFCRLAVAWAGQKSAVNWLEECVEYRLITVTLPDAAVIREMALADAKQKPEPCGECVHWRATCNLTGTTVKNLTGACERFTRPFPEITRGVAARLDVGVVTRDSTNPEEK